MFEVPLGRPSARVPQFESLLCRRNRELVKRLTLPRVGEMAPQRAADDRVGHVYGGVVAGPVPLDAAVGQVQTGMTAQLMDQNSGVTGDECGSIVFEDAKGHRRTG